MKSRQSGVTLIGFLIIMAIVGFIAYMAMKLFPSYSEYMGVVKAMNQVATEGTNGKSLDDIRRGLMFKMGFQYVDDALGRAAVEVVDVEHDSLDARQIRLLRLLRPL